MFNIPLLALCEKSYMMQIILIIKTFFKIACFIIPIIIIIVSMIQIFKVVTTGKEEDLKESFNGTLKRIIAGLIIFLLPNLINYIFTGIVDVQEVEFLSCFQEASKEKVASLKAKEESAAEAEKKQQEKEDEVLLRKAYEEEQKKRDANKKSFEEWKKEKEEEERRQQQQQQSAGGGSSTGGSAGSIVAEISPGTSNIFIGDSRMVGLCATITGDWSKCQFSNGGKINGADIFIAQGSQGYSWFNSTALNAVNQKLSQNPNVKYNIYTWMGVNFLLSDIDKYISKYNELINGQWKNHIVILVSVGPVNESIEAQHGYSTKNVNIQTFNAKLKNGVRGSNVAYCDIYTPLGTNFGTADGLHYTGNTYNQIYNLMKQC